MYHDYTPPLRNTTQNSLVHGSRFTYLFTFAQMLSDSQHCLSYSPKKIIRSSVVAERPRDASSLSVQYPERSLLLLVTSASNLPIRTILSCCRRCNVEVFFVINKIYWCVARQLLLIAGDGRRISAITYTPLSKCWWHATVKQWSMSKPDIGGKSRFCPS